MFNRSKHMIAAGLALAIGALGNAGFKAQRFETHAERRARRGKPITSRFFWGGSRKFCPPGGGPREVARRLRQIEAGTLLTSLGQVRLNASRVLRAGQERVIYDHLAGNKAEGVVVAPEASRTVDVMKHTAVGKSEPGPIVVYQGAAEMDPHHQ